MRILSLSIFILLSGFSLGQTRWFKHLPGWQARNTLVKGDTLLTCGMDYTTLSFGDKFNTFLYWNNLKGDSLGIFKINLDSIENNPERSTIISYNYTSSVFDKKGTTHFINLDYGGKKSRAFQFKISGFLSNNFNLEENTIDTFSTFINNKIFNSSVNILFIPYMIVSKPLERTANTIIYKERNGSKVKIKEIVNTSSVKYETLCHIKDNTSEKSFFFILHYMTDYAGAPQVWQDYIIKMDTLGNELWRVAPNNRDSINPEGMQMVQKPNGNLLVSWCDEMYRPYKNPLGSNEPQLNRKCTVWFAEIDSNGKILWRKNIKNYISTKMIDTTQNLIHRKAISVVDGIIWTGNHSYYYYHNYLLKTDYNGNPIWYREYELYKGNTAEQEFKPYDITATSDGGYVLTGEFISEPGNIFPKGCQLATIIKVDSFGCLEPGCQKGDSVPVGVRQIKNLKQCKVYPNPADDWVRVQVPLGKKNTYVMEVYNMTGKLIEKMVLHESSEVNTANYPNGFYLFKLYNETQGEIETYKISIYH